MPKEQHLTGEGKRRAHVLELAKLAGAPDATESLGGEFSFSLQTPSEMASALAEASAQDPLAYPVPKVDKRSLARLIDTGISELLSKGGDARLDGDQLNALEAIVLLRGRPALLIKDDSFEAPAGTWSQLVPFRDQIQTVIRSVGRIGISTGFPELPYLGTGFMVSKDLLMTNAHVAEVFTEKKRRGWAIKPRMEAVVDFVQEFGSARELKFPIAGVVGIHAKLDLALLQLAPVRNQAMPKALKLEPSDGFAVVNNRVFTVGYPAADPERNDPQEMNRIFGGIYEKKRLSPGRITAVQKWGLQHDCTTLGGCSGACVVSLDTGKVIGLHYQGRYRDSNDAILLQKFRQDAMLSGLNFK